MRILAPARLSASDAVAAVLMISGLARWQAIDRPAPSRAASRRTPSGTSSPSCSTPTHYPALAAALADGGLSDEEADDPFRFALERALDGLDASWSGPATPPTEPADLIGRAGGSVDQVVDYPRDARLKEATRIAPGGRGEGSGRRREGSATRARESCATPGGGSAS